MQKKSKEPMKEEENQHAASERRGFVSTDPASDKELRCRAEMFSLMIN